MLHDCVIRGGTLIDGTGAPAFEGDLAIDQGCISAIGKVDGTGRQEIDARGLAVTPGFVDIHTHLDAQIGWDPDCTPVVWHGVTTALLGNCGVSFAPCRPGEQARLAAMMETVEDIPRQAILTGLPWDWEDYGGYLDAIERIGPAINIAGLIGHSALRYYVMGERAVEEQATAQERHQMAQLVGQALDRGAVGFSTNRFAPHKLPDGRSIPGTFADPVELIEIARQVAARGGLMQAVGADFNVLRAIADEGGARVLCSYGGAIDAPTARQRRDALEQLCTGRDITAVTQVRSSGLIFGLQGLLPGRGAAWAALRKLDLAGRLAAIEDPNTATALVEEARREDFPPILGTGIDQVFYMGMATTPDYDAGPSMSLVVMAEAAGEHWSQTFLRLSRESKGRCLFTLRMFNPDMSALAHLIGSERVIPSLGDAGAHVSQIMDSGWASFVLAHWVRDTGVYSLEEAVRRMTTAPARVIGLRDRGRLAVGLRADINVLDAQKVSECQPRIVHDFPGGAPRYIQEAIGYKATLVNGEQVVRDGVLSGRRSGRVLRHVPS